MKSRIMSSFSLAHWCLAFAAGLLAVTPARSYDAQLLGTFNQGTEIGGSIWVPDTVGVSVVIITDTDTAVGAHTLTYANSYRPNVVFNVGKNGVITGGSTIDYFNISSTYPGPGYVMPPSFTVGQDPGPYTTTVTASLEVNPKTGVPFDTKTLTVKSVFHWDSWLRPTPPAVDPQLGYEDVYSSQSRQGQFTQQPITLYLPGAKALAKMQPYCKKPQGPTADPDTDQGCGCAHMAVASLDRFQTGVAISDAPVMYSPPVGPAMVFQVTYHQRLDNQPTTFNYSNVGPLWSSNWISYIAGGPTNAFQSATYYGPGGNQYSYGGYQATATDFTQGDFTDNEGWGLATLHYRQGPERYERWLPDGSIEIYAQAVGTSPNRNFFLTSIQDPQGNVTTLTYDSAGATNGYAILKSVTDPTGQQLTFGYDNPDGLKITKVTRSCDGLSAKFEYTNGQLTSSTDTIGISSTFSYTTGSNFINSMTTPYGTTTFSSTDGSGFLEADMTNPLGQTERVEYQETLPTADIPDYGAPTPSYSGLNITPTNLNLHNSFYWSRIELASASGAPVDSAAYYAAAEITHWAEGELGAEPVALSTKMPLEGRVWYNYPAQTAPETVDLQAAGTFSEPSLSARLVDSPLGPVTEARTATFNLHGLVTQVVDPKGRTTNYTYYHYGTLPAGQDDIDQKQATQINTSSPAGFDVLSTRSNYIYHFPQQITDLAGQNTVLAYNGQGQVTSKTVTVGGANQLTLSSYTGPGGTGTGNFLTTVTAPLGATTKYTYDGSDRMSSLSDTTGYMTQFGYDNLDRLTRKIYPGGQMDQIAYHILDQDHTIDRQSRITQNVYDAIRELIQNTDPQGHVTKYSWCLCGGMATMTDPSSNVTTWIHDVEGRVTSKVFADASKYTYTYEPNTSRLSTMADAKGIGATAGNVSSYVYDVDGALLNINYAVTTLTAAASVTSPTTSVTFTLDTAYPRVLTMHDATGTTHYAYVPIVNGSNLGAGNLLSATVPIAGTGSTALIGYTYDELGRQVTRTIDGANPVTTYYDALGRTINVTNALATAMPGFTYGYVNSPSPTYELASITYPAASHLTENYSYASNAQDLERLQEISAKVGSTPLSDFQYTYNPVGTIATWRQQSDSSPAVTNTIKYDNADQLGSSTQSGALTNAYGYYYDPSGNRLSETVNGTTTAATQFNNLNQVTRRSATPTTTSFVGYTSGALTNAMVNAVPASITNTTNFSATVAMPIGTNIVSVVAQPISTSTAPTTTNRYKVVTSGTPPTPLTYDLNGNILTDENGNSYAWDAQNRVAKITYPNAAYTIFVYDGRNRRAQIVEYGSTQALTSTKNYIWIDGTIAEERSVSGTVAGTKRFFSQGEQQVVGGTTSNYYYTRDHLGSVRELCSNTGSIVARYSYDSYGRTTLVSGTNTATFQYANYYEHQPSGLNLTLYRAYDPSSGRWLSRDPLKNVEMKQGPNSYEYVKNDPEDKTDPLGLESGRGNPCPCGTHSVANYTLLGYPDAISCANDQFLQMNNNAGIFASGAASNAAWAAGNWKWGKSLGNGGAAGVIAGAVTEFISWITLETICEQTHCVPNKNK